MQCGGVMNECLPLPATADPGLQLGGVTNLKSISTIPKQPTNPTLVILLSGKYLEDPPEGALSIEAAHQVGSIGTPGCGLSVECEQTVGANRLAPLPGNTTHSGCRGRGRQCGSYGGRGRQPALCGLCAPTRCVIL